MECSPVTVFETTTRPMFLSSFYRTLILLAVLLFSISASKSHAQIDAAIRSEVSKQGGAIASWYKQRGYQPVWSGDRLGGLAQFIQGLNAHGLHPELFQFSKWDQTWRNSDQSPAVRAQIDVGTTHLALFAIQSAAYGFVDPTKVHTKWREVKRTVTSYDFLNDALKQPGNRLGDALLGKVPPQDQRYQQMVKELARYRMISSRGGWRNLAVPPQPVGPGGQYESVVLLRSRLMSEGDMPPNNAKYKGTTIDNHTGDAIKSFQFRHGIDPDGYLGAQTIAEFNKPAQDRVNALIINLDRLRWMPRAYEQSAHIEVNICESALRVYDSRRRITTMPVIVGVKGKHQTPVFHGSLQYLVFRPYWNVPLSIASKELIPKALAQPGFMERNRYEIYNSKGVQPITTENLKRVAAGSLQMRQGTGEGNALGLVKFIFPNDSSVYLHDTSDRHLFKQTDRDFSHGCVRVSRPPELAEIVLKNNGGWSRQKVEDAMADTSNPNRKENLKKPIPVYLMYWSAFIMGDNRVRFDQDIYGHDATMFQKFGIR